MLDAVTTNANISVTSVSHNLIIIDNDGVNMLSEANIPIQLW